MHRSRDFPHAPVLSVLTFAFALRVAGQAVQRWLPQPYLPAFVQWQGSATPYPLLLALQLVILALMVRAYWRIRQRASSPHRPLGRRLAWLGGLYMTGSLARIVVGLAVPSAPAWFSAWISGAFHVVLAAFVLTVAHYHLTSPAMFR